MPATLSGSSVRMIPRLDLHPHGRQRGEARRQRREFRGDHTNPGPGVRRLTASGTDRFTDRESGSGGTERGKIELTESLGVVLDPPVGVVEKEMCALEEVARTSDHHRVDGGGPAGCGPTGHGILLTRG